MGCRSGLILGCHFYTLIPKLHLFQSSQGIVGLRIQYVSFIRLLSRGTGGLCRVTSLSREVSATP